MAAVSGVSPSSVLQPPARLASRDADGDNDGTKAAAAAPRQAPVISKPTATLGNRVNTYA